MPLRIPAFREALVQMSGDPLITHNVGGNPACAGFAFDGTYFYLNDRIGAEIHVYTAAGVFVRTMSLSLFYSDIDYDPLGDELLGVSSSYTGIYRFSKTDGSLLGTYGAAESALLDDNFTSIAVDRDNDLLYLEHSGGMWIYAFKMSTFDNERIIYVPSFVAPAPAMSISSTMMIALDAEDRKKIWVGYQSFPPMLGRIDEDGKVDAYRVLGTGYGGGKLGIGMRFVNDRWYCWVGAELGIGKVYALSGMPGPTKLLPAVVYPKFDQDLYRWYEDDNAESPTAKAAENTGVENLDMGDVLRLRLGVEETSGSPLVWSGFIRLQYAYDPAGPWEDVGEQGATGKAWTYHDGLGEDGAEIASLLLSTSSAKQYFVESYPSAYCFEFRKPDRGESDFCIEYRGSLSEQDYYFRALVQAFSFSTYTAYPTARTIFLGSLEDFTTYEEHDPTGKITVDASRITWASLNKVDEGYVVEDMGSGHFGDFVHRFEVRLTSTVSYSEVGLWCVSNSKYSPWLIRFSQAIYVLWEHRDGYNRLRLDYKDGANPADDHTGPGVVQKNETYYLTVERSGGSVTCKIFSDAERTVLVDTLSITMFVPERTYRYLFGFAGFDADATNYPTSGYVENLLLVE